MRLALNHQHSRLGQLQRGLPSPLLRLSNSRFFNFRALESRCSPRTLRGRYPLQECCRGVFRGVRGYCGSPTHCSRALEGRIRLYRPGYSVGNTGTLQMLYIATLRAHRSPQGSRKAKRASTRTDGLPYPRLTNTLPAPIALPPPSFLRFRSDSSSGFHRFGRSHQEPEVDSLSVRSPRRVAFQVDCFNLPGLRVRRSSSSAILSLFSFPHCHRNGFNNWVRTRWVTSRARCVSRC